MKKGMFEMNQWILLDAASTQSAGGMGSLLLMLLPYALVIVPCISL